MLVRAYRVATIMFLLVLSGTSFLTSCTSVSVQICRLHSTAHVLLMITHIL